MVKKYKLSLFIFRRDLRLHDNTGLIEALKSSEEVLPIFILDKNQITELNEYKSNNSIQFMFESLKELDKNLKEKTGKLFLFYGEPVRIIKNLLQSYQIEAIFVNEDYTPYSIKRDKDIKNLASNLSVNFVQYHDLLLIKPHTFTTKTKQFYKIFTPFFKAAFKETIPVPQKNSYKNFFNKKVVKSESFEIFNKFLKKNNNQIWVHSSTKNIEEILNNLDQFKNYKNERNLPYLNTTNLSAYLKFGVCSIRQAYHAVVNQLGKSHDLIRELFWRDFFTYIAFHNPHIFGNAFKEKFNNIPWKNDKKAFKAWCEGKTGFPIVDAGMRQLLQTGFMHNRVRMITASFLVKDLHIDWKKGEKFFAQHLVDYDPSVNNGNWQWIASTGTDAMPYFRIFNPWTQQKKFDPECKYIKKWIPELEQLSPKIIHTIYKHTIKNYPQPIIEHSKESKITLKIYTKTF